MQLKEDYKSPFQGPGISSVEGQRCSQNSLCSSASTGPPCVFFSRAKDDVLSYCRGVQKVEREHEATRGSCVNANRCGRAEIWSRFLSIRVRFWGAGEDLSSAGRAELWAGRTEPVRPWTVNEFSVPVFGAELVDTSTCCHTNGELIGTMRAPLHFKRLDRLQG